MARRATPPHWRQLMDRRGIPSVRRLAEKAGLSHTAVNNVVHGDSQETQEGTLARIASALDVPLAQIYELAGMSAGHVATWSPPAEAARLNPRQRRAVEELIRSMVDLEREAGDGDVRDAAPITRAGGSPATERDLLQTPELALVSDEDQHPLDTQAVDELERRRRERHVAEGGLPVDEELMTGYSEPQESILERDAQDADAEGSQVPPEEDD